MLLMLKSVLKQRVNIQFCIPNKSSAIQKQQEPTITRLVLGGRLSSAIVGHCWRVYRYEPNGRLMTSVLPVTRQVSGDRRHYLWEEASTDQTNLAASHTNSSTEHRPTVGSILWLP